MNKNKDYPEFGPDPGDSDDVEILEVVGIEDHAEAPESIEASDEASGEAPDEYLLDFDAPESDMLPEAEAPPPSPAAASTGSFPESEGTDRDKLLRLRADYDNLRKRIKREREEFELNANCDLVSRLLPVVDNLERALAANASGGTEGVLREGLVMIQRQLTAQLREVGLVAIETVGQNFDPNLHDAVATDSASEYPANTVIEEMQRGYLFQERVLRPAMVKVSTGSAESEEGD